MAESTEKKAKKSRASFADDLDSMLNVDDAKESQVGLIDDDDAIDRLLVGDVFAEQARDEIEDDFGDIDQLIASEQVRKTEILTDIDEFGDDDIDDIIAGLEINPKQIVHGGELGEELPELETAAPEVDSSELEVVGEIDEFADQPAVELEIEAVEPVVEPRLDEFDSMTEIDEFAAGPVADAVDNADFLLADFNISVDDEDVAASPKPVDISSDARESLQPETRPELFEATMESADELDEFAGSESMAADVSVDTEAFVEEQEVSIESRDTMQVPPESEAVVPPPPIAKQPVAASISQIDYGPQLAILVEQFNELKKLQKQTHHDLQFKVDNEALTACLETVDALQTEQKKTKRGLDALVSKKPVGVYIANGVAGVAMLVAVGMGVEVFIAKSQLEQLVGIIGQVKQQIESAPAVDAADKALMSKQLDELAVAQGVASSQIAELTKAMHGDAGAEKPVGDFGKQLNDLSNQDMQMGAAIEALQNKVAALEKGKVTVVAAPKPAPKKPVVEENWAVNLVAFKQDWYAKRKAEEFAGKGIPAKVTRADNKGETWYRLSVDGFKSQYEAAAYAAKVKKSLNLDSVWVAKNKD